MGRSFLISSSDAGTDEERDDDENVETPPGTPPPAAPSTPPPTGKKKNKRKTTDHADDQENSRQKQNPPPRSPSPPSPAGGGLFDDDPLPSPFHTDIPFSIGGDYMDLPASESIEFGNSVSSQTTFGFWHKKAGLWTHWKTNVSFNSVNYARFAQSCEPPGALQNNGNYRWTGYQNVALPKRSGQNFFPPSTVILPS